MRAVAHFFVRVGAAFVVVVVLYTGYIAFTVWHQSVIDEAAPADAIVVLGAAQYNGRPSPVLKARLDHAAALWREGLASKIVVTGGRIPGDPNTEAGASAAYLATLGVPDASVLREVQGRTSWESLQAAARFMKQRGIVRVILVSDGFHDARIKAMSKDLGLDPLVSPATESPIQGADRLPYFAKEVLSLGVGKVFGFHRLASLERNFTAT